MTNEMWAEQKEMECPNVGIHGHQNNILSGKGYYGKWNGAS